MAEVGGVFFLVFKADLVRHKLDGLAFKIGERLFLVLQKEGLFDVGQLTDFLAVLNGLAISTMVSSPIPYTPMSAVQSIKTLGFRLSDQ